LCTGLTEPLCADQYGHIKDATVVLFVPQPPLLIEDIKVVTNPQTKFELPLTDLVTVGTDADPQINFGMVPNLDIKIENGQVIITPGAKYEGGYAVKIPVTVTDKYGNTSTSTLELTVNKGPQAFDDELQMDANNEGTIDLSDNDLAGNASIDWTKTTLVNHPVNGRVELHTDGTVIYIPYPGFIGSDEFTYQIVDMNGLTSTAVVRVQVSPRELIIPNMFTPDGDGINDVFEIVGIEGFDRVEISIVNRWGNEVYRSTNYKNTWSGAGLNDGTYYYVIKTVKGSTIVPYSGWVLIKSR